MPTTWSRTFVALAVLLGAGVARSAPSPFTLDDAHWTVTTSGSGPTASMSGGSLLVSMPATSSGTTFSGQVSSACMLTGDFDIQVDFRLVEWPFASGVRSAILVRDAANNFHGAVDRTSFGSAQDYYGYPREVYLAGFANNAVTGIVATSDATGTLRLVRTGTTLTTYHASAGGWTTVDAGAITAADLRPQLAAWSHDYAFTDQAVQVALEGFRVNRGNVVCGGRILVAVDVKPGSFPNPVTLGSNGVTPVAILSTADFDATQIDPATVTVAGAPVTIRQDGTLIWSIEDVDDDGWLDLLVHVDTQRLQVDSSSTSVAVEGSTRAGAAFVGSDAIVVVP